MKSACRHCNSNEWTPHSGWIQDGFIHTTHQCIQCEHRVSVYESVEEFNKALDNQEQVHDLRNLPKGL